MTDTPRISKFEAVLLTAMFIVLITLPFLKQVIFGEAKTEMIEGRRLNPMPAVSWKKFSTFKEFPTAFDHYYDDHFGFRSVLLKMGSHVGVKYANVSLSPDVIIGKSGWLFMKNEPNQESFLDGSILSDAVLDQWKRGFERRQAWLSRRGIKYLLVIPPVKQDIYPEFMPDKYSHVRVKPLGEQLRDYLLAHHSSVEILYLREPLQTAKTAAPDERLYYRSDTHWNTLGAYIGYRSIIGSLHQWFPELQPLDRSAFSMEKELCHGDLARTMGEPDYSADNEALLKLINPVSSMVAADTHLGFNLQNPRVTRESNAGSGNRRRAVMQHDSFTVLLIPMLAENFARISYLPNTDPNMKSEQALAALITQEKPDVFIEERLERFLLIHPLDENAVFGGGE